MEAENFQTKGRLQNLIEFFCLNNQLGANIEELFRQNLDNLNRAN